LRLIYDELREATQPATTRELAERIMRVKAIPAADDCRERVQKTLLASLNRAKLRIPTKAATYSNLIAATIPI
jgi:hypothetical protein